MTRTDDEIKSMIKSLQERNEWMALHKEPCEFKNAMIRINKEKIKALQWVLNQR